MATKPKELNIVALSGICWPTKSRKYMIEMIKEVVAQTSAKFVVVAGHTVDGKFLEKEHRAREKERIAERRREVQEERRQGKKHAYVNVDWEKAEFEREFVEEYSRQLAAFLPVLPNKVNWHIAIAEKVYDRPIGAKILEKVRDNRKDVRIIGERQQEDYDLYDPEPKVPVQFGGFEEIRVILPRRVPWFSKILSTLMQRVLNAFTPRTLSPRPSLVIVGCTGTGIYIPNYEGVPSVTPPALHKISEKQSSEHMIGCSVIRVVSDGRNGVRIVNGVHNWRTAVYLEKRVAIPSSLPKTQRAVMTALVPSDSSFSALMYRMNEPSMRKRFGRKTKYKEAEVRAALDGLRKDGSVVFHTRSNRYGIPESLIKDADITLASLREGSRRIKHFVMSCFHGGAQKTLYATAFEDVPGLGADADAIIENGDLIQGISHNYLTNGELYPIANGFDKQELLNAYIRAKWLLDIFKKRLQTLSGRTTMKPEELLDRCLVPYVYSLGNHSEWNYYNRDALILQQFHSTLINRLIEGIIEICAEQRGIEVRYADVKKTVEAKIIRRGESRLVELDGITVAIKHPFKGRTISKTHRIQDVTDFIWRRINDHLTSVAKRSQGYTVAYVANYHEAAAALVTKYGQTVQGVMTGAYMSDTEFENHKDKVIDTGPCVVMLEFDDEGRPLYTETEFVSRINEEDRKYVLSDRLDSAQVLERSKWLLDQVGLKMPWR